MAYHIDTYCKFHYLHIVTPKVNRYLTSYVLAVNAEPVTCPFRGPFTFTYNRGQGECSYPVSTIDSCADDTHLLFRFQACADVMNTESSVEELTCLATWKEGSAHYLVGRVHYPANYVTRHNDHNNYRCFIYDQIPDQRGGYQVSQSGDPTCDGLVNSWEGSRILRVIKSKHPSIGCQFPAWVTLGHRWHTLDGSNTYTFSARNTTFRTSNPEDKVTCTEDLTMGENVSTFVGYSVSGW
ncbi:hypothetical protein LAZ67_6001626 [Cordylochernes scorpioides]|uniref:DUF7042 domain-containing protein n=1 Tax=Cordylochernes scorpioides TaxID=51811 RepID=A0ABY6KL43_9ARAC|nr:hypothetical protein LAZ67_6001626 [Cordylochernes scorpioides]